MPATLNANWTAAMAGDPDIRILVDIWWGSGAGDLLTLAYNPGGGPVFGYSPLVRSIAPMTASVGLQDATQTLGRIDVELVWDTELRALLRDRFLANKRVRVRVGEARLAEVDYEPRWHGMVMEVEPKKSGHVLQCAEPFWLLKDAKRSVDYEGQHPLTALYALLADVLPASIILASSFDPSAAGYADISHWVVQRHTTAWGVQIATEPTSVMDECGELLEILGGSLVLDEAGLVMFSRTDLTAAVARSFAEGTAVDLEQPTAYGRALNRISWCHGWRGEEHDENHGPIIAGGDPAQTAINLAQWVAESITTRRLRTDEYAHEWMRQDTAAQDRAAYHDGSGLPAGTKRKIEERRIASHWLNAAAYLETGFLAGLGAGGTFVLYGTGVAGFCGLGGYTRGAAIPAWAQLRAAPAPARSIWIRLDSEIIRCDAAVPDDDEVTWEDWVHNWRGVDINPGAARYLPARATFTIAQRGCFGTNVVDHVAYDPFAWIPGYRFPPGLALDATIPITRTDQIADRHCDGIVTLQFDSNLSYSGAYLRELVELQHVKIPNFYTKDGVLLTDGLVWEVIGCEEDWTGRPPRIIWTVALVGVGKAGAQTYTSTGGDQQGSRARSMNCTNRRTAWAQRIESGLLIATGSGGGLTGQVGAGLYGSGRGGLEGMPSALDAIPLDATRHHWMVVDHGTGGVVTRFKTAAGAPAARAGYHELGDLLTNAVAVATVTDERKLTAQSFRAWAPANKGAGPAAWTTVDATTEAFDHGAAGLYGWEAPAARFRAPYPLKLAIKANVEMIGHNVPADLPTRYLLGVFVNGGLVTVVGSYRQTVVVEEFSMSGSTELDLAAKDDLVDVRVYNPAPAGVATIVLGATLTWIGGERSY